VKNCSAVSDLWKSSHNSVQSMLQQFAVCYNLFAKMSQPGDSEVTFAVFESSCHQSLPV